MLEIILMKTAFIYHLEFLWHDCINDVYCKLSIHQLRIKSKSNQIKSFI